MTFLAPAFMVAAGFIAAGVVLAHFIVTREPQVVRLPTARFAPSRPVRARSRRIRPQDLLLMLLRVLLILAVGAGLAQPVINPPHQELARIILVDHSRAVADPVEVADSARALVTEEGALILFDSSPTVVRTDPLAVLEDLTRSSERASLSAALIEAFRTASELREHVDSIELAIVSPLATEAVDLATDSIRALWPAAIRVVQTEVRTEDTEPTGITFDGPEDDPLRVALPEERLASGPDADSSSVLLVRNAPTPADSSWAEERGRALVHWPVWEAAEEEESILVPQPWVEKTTPDTTGAVTVEGAATVVAAFTRWASYDEGGSGRAASENPEEDQTYSVLARWADGTPAAIEEPHGKGCVRTVMIDVPTRGDLVLQPRFRRIAAALAERCSDRLDPVPLDSTYRASLENASSGRFVAGESLVEPEVIEAPLVPWLFAAALLFAATALFVRRRTARRAARYTVGGEE